MSVDAITYGMSVLESLFPSTFTIDGRTESFVGVVDSHSKGKKIGIGGYGEDADAILEARKAQFGVTPPRDGVRLTSSGRRYVIDRIVEDHTSYRLILMGVNQ